MEAPPCPPTEDDIYLWSHDKGFLQSKLGIMVRSLGARNLKVNATKTKYIHTMEGEQVIKVGDKEVKGERDGTVTVLGAPVALAGEVLRTSQRWPDEHEGHSQHTKNSSRGQGVLTTSCWHTLGMQMLHTKRRPLEQWADWNRRSLRQARACLATRPLRRWSTIALTQVWKLWGHTARREQHTGLMLGWRNQEWWRAEQSNAHGLRHPHRFNAMLETEKMVEKVAKPWRQQAQNRDTWKQMERSFAQRFDPPWSSSKQPSLENLAPN